MYRVFTTPTIHSITPPVDGAKPGEKGAQLLVLLNDVAKASPADEALVKSVSRIFFLFWCRSVNIR